jgi:hypothetical protein
LAFRGLGTLTSNASVDAASPVFTSGMNEFRDLSLQLRTFVRSRTALVAAFAKGGSFSKLSGGEKPRRTKSRDIMRGVS